MDYFQFISSLGNFLFKFSVNGSGRFLGIAQMSSEIDNNSNFNYWSQNDKWKGFFYVNWLVIKDVSNKYFKHLFNEYNEGKCVISSRDTQEIIPVSGFEMLKIFKESKYESSILDDFNFYEQKLESNSKIGTNDYTKPDELGNEN